MHAIHTPRHTALDLLRGAAMVWMTAFHFCFDLQYFGYLHTDFYANMFWTVQRQAIVSLFLFCAGVGQAIAVSQHQPWSRFWRRWAQVGAAALLVSAASYAMFPGSYIYFGVLHGMALMLILGRCAVRLDRWLWPLGALALCLPILALPLHSQWELGELLNTRGLNWLGLISRKPITEDYVPLFPWLGVLLWGVASGNWWLRRRGVRATDMPATNTPAIGRVLAWLGRNSLPYYLVHQPVLLGVLTLVTQLNRA